MTVSRTARHAGDATRDCVSTLDHESSRVHRCSPIDVSQAVSADGAAGTERMSVLHIRSMSGRLAATSSAGAAGSALTAAADGNEADGADRSTWRAISLAVGETFISAGIPSPFGRRFNSDGEGMSAK